ncbi:MAG: TRAP transporter small permease [Rhodospirillales bacterium]|nr:TRAP transporter small permease [Rhodospirillales bacterium]
MLANLLERYRALEMALAAALLSAIVTLVVVASVARYYGYPVIWALELTQAGFVWLCVLSSDLTLRRAGHFSIDMLAKLLPARARLVLELANLAIVATLLAVLVYFGWEFSARTSGRPLPITGITSAFVTAALPVGFALMLVTLGELALARLRGQPVGPAEDELREVI